MPRRRPSISNASASQTGKTAEQPHRRRPTSMMREAERQRQREPHLGHAKARHLDPGHLVRRSRWRAGSRPPGTPGPRPRRTRPAPVAAMACARTIKRGHAHMLAAVQRHRRADHAEPEKHRLRELISPDQRMSEHVAGDDADEQDDDLGRDQQRRDDSRQRINGRSMRGDRRRRATGSGHRRDVSAAVVRRPGGRPSGRWTVGADQVNGPVISSSRAQASGPIFSFHSL